MSPDSPAGDDPRSARRAHLRDESAVRSLGRLCDLVAAFSALGTLEFALVAAGTLPVDPRVVAALGPARVRVLAAAFAVLLLLNAAFQRVLGYGLGRLRAWARWLVVALTALSLASGFAVGLGLCFAFPAWGVPGLGIGVALHALILHPLLTPGAGVVFSPEYREVVRATPEIRARMHWLLKLAIALILAGVAGFAAFLAAIVLRIVE